MVPQAHGRSREGGGDGNYNDYLFLVGEAERPFPLAKTGGMDGWRFRLPAQWPCKRGAVHRRSWKGCKQARPNCGGFRRIRCLPYVDAQSEFAVITPRGS